MAQRVLITAGAGGIGRAIARAFAADGAMVHIADVDAEAVEAVTLEQERISGSVTDVSDPRAVAALFGDVRTRLGGHTLRGACFYGSNCPKARAERMYWRMRFANEWPSCRGHRCRCRGCAHHPAGRA